MAEWSGDGQGHDKGEELGRDAGVGGNVINTDWGTPITTLVLSLLCGSGEFSDFHFFLVFHIFKLLLKILPS